MFIFGRQWFILRELHYICCFSLVRSWASTNSRFSSPDFEVNFRSNIFNQNTCILYFQITTNKTQREQIKTSSLHDKQTKLIIFTLCTCDQNQFKFGECKIFKALEESLLLADVNWKVRLIYKKLRKIETKIGDIHVISTQVKSQLSQVFFKLKTSPGILILEIDLNFRGCIDCLFALARYAFSG